MAGKLSHFLESNSLLHPSPFSYRISLGTCDALLTLSHHLQDALNRGMEERLIQLDFSAAFDRVTQCGLLYKLRSIDVGEQFLPLVSKSLSDRRQLVRLNGKASASVNVVSGLFLFILYTSKLFHIHGNYIVEYADTIYARIH